MDPVLYQCKAGTERSRRTGSCPQPIQGSETRLQFNPSQRGQERTERVKLLQPLPSDADDGIKAGVETQHAGTGMCVQNATHPTTPVEKAYVPPSPKPTQASLPSALVFPFVEKVQEKGNRVEPIATSSNTASEVINAL